MSDGRSNLDAEPSRLDRALDTIEIYNLLASHPPIIDALDFDAMRAMFTEDGVFDRGAFGVVGIADMSPNAGMQEAAEQGLGHLSTMPLVRVAGDRAIAVNYVAATVTEQDASPMRVGAHGVSAGHRLFRVTANRWELRRIDGQWRVSRRTAMALDGGQEVRQFIGTALHAAID